MRVQVQVRAGMTGGYPYYRWELRETVDGPDGLAVWRTVGHSKRFRSDLRGKRRFPGVPTREEARVRSADGTLVPLRP